jgi:hypothetical protein
MSYGKSYGKTDVNTLAFGVQSISIAYIASFLKSNGCDVRPVDLT